MYGNGNPWTPYQPQPYRPQQNYAPQPNQQMMDMGMINARYVTCREEAVAAQILPDGNPYLFVDAAQGRIYSKCFNPRTNAPEFREYGMIQQHEQPQYASADAVAALSARLDSIEQILKMEAV